MRSRTAGALSAKRLSIQHRQALALRLRRQGYAWAEIPPLLRRLADSRGDGSPVLMKGMNSVRDFIDVRDVAEAYLAILDLDPPADRTFNVCTGRPRSIGDLVAAVLDLLGSSREVRFEGHPNSSDDIPYLVGCPDRLAAATGWRPALSLEQSLQSMLDSVRRVAHP